MPARYVYRIDDVTPTMNWAQFWKYVDLFGSRGIKPLLGIVPENRDPQLMVDRENPSFWKILKQLRDEDRIEVAQHGYQHLYQTGGYGLLGKRLGFSPQSEFVGLSYPDQVEKIRSGRAILQSHGLDTDVWMAPSHSFDRTTLGALRDCGFGAVTDGIAVFPFRSNGLVFVPQQLWSPKSFPLGVWTICLHPNTAGEQDYERVREHVASRSTIISFSLSRELVASLPGAIANRAFEAAYAVHIWRHRIRPRRSGKADEA